ncbi:AraC family transcriptional regulator ligand-binding domain-containing protein [Undibacterium sp. Ren11W]|uniref:AraC family transcriptional regulator n=1 Tax=Undibacterium sp. Ren11W TaxID=3413045 RepID=UPI003BF0C127
MSRQSATVAISMATDFLAGFHPDTELVRAVIGHAEIAPEVLLEQGGRITIEQFSALLRQAALLLDDETPRFFSRPLRNGTLKFLCLGMLDSPNLDIALHRFVSYFRLLLDDMGFQVTRGTKLTRIALIEHVAPQGMRVMVHELMLKLVHGVASWMIGRKIPLAQVDFSFPRPARAAEYVYLFPGPINFDKAETALYIESEYLSAPLRQDKSALNQFLRNAPADWLYVSFSDKILTHRIRDHLESRLADVTTVASTAKALHFSVRTLSRRLAQEGSTFQTVKDELRRDMAILQLIKTELPVAAIGLNLGFDDPTTFSRAFKLWTGSAPGAYRRLGTASKLNQV